VGVVSPKARKAWELFLPWAALIAAAFAWVASQQIGSDLAFADCSVAGWWWVGLIGLLALALAAAGGGCSPIAYGRGGGGRARRAASSL
jgi:hypothetical protein